MKDTLSIVGILGLYVVTFLGWIYNIVWIFNSWEHLSTMAKMIDIASIFFFPLGAFFGCMHFLGL